MFAHLPYPSTCEQTRLLDAEKPFPVVLLVINADNGADATQSLSTISPSISHQNAPPSGSKAWWSITKCSYESHAARIVPRRPAARSQEIPFLHSLAPADRYLQRKELSADIILERHSPLKINVLKQFLQSRLETYSEILRFPEVGHILPPVNKLDPFHLMELRSRHELQRPAQTPVLTDDERDLIPPLDQMPHLNVDLTTNSQECGA